MPRTIPYADLETLFLDVGNTLVSMDFTWVQRELAGLGVRCKVGELVRAEAAARPAVSASLGNHRSAEDVSLFECYLRELLVNLLSGIEEKSRIDGLVAPLVEALHDPARERLWSRVLPGVPEALEAFRDMGIQLAVVSNSNGTVEQVLIRQGLRSYFGAVFDSHLVGAEKPDPRIFLHALEQTGACADRTLHIGDSYHADVVGARKAGLHALLLDPFDDWPHVDCLRVPDLMSLKRELELVR